MLAVLIGGGWYLLNGVRIANLQPIMKLRQYYYFKLPSTLNLKTARLPFSVLPVQTVSVSQSDTGLYVYAFYGKFEKMDTARGILYLKDKHNQTYGFKYSATASGLAYYETVDGKQAQKFLDLAPADFPAREAGFNSGDILLVYWADERKLAEILDSARENPDKQLNPDTAINHYQQIILTGK